MPSKNQKRKCIYHVDLKLNVMAGHILRESRVEMSFYRFIGGTYRYSKKYNTTDMQCPIETLIKSRSTDKLEVRSQAAI